MRGQWVRIRPHHECVKPSVRRKGVGSRWRCKCGQVWELTGREQVGILQRTFWRVVNDEA